MSQLTIAEALERVGRSLQAHYDPDPIPRAALVREVARATGCSESSVLPSDFCYNVVNRAEFSCTRPMFIREARGRYRFLGRGHERDVAGPVFWRPVGGREQQVGRWIKGRLLFDHDPRDRPRRGRQ